MNTRRGSERLGSVAVMIHDLSRHSEVV